MRRFSMMIIPLLFACTTHTTQNYSLDQDSKQNEPGDAMEFMSEINPGLPTVGVKKQGWSASGTLVGQEKWPTNDTGNREVSLQVDFPQAGAYTVQFNLTPKLPLTNHPVVAEASLLWSVEGNLVQRKVTVGNGTSISGVGQAVKVVVKDRTPATGPQESQEYVVGISVAPGTRANPLVPATIINPTQKRVTVPAAGSVDIAIPQGAGVSSVYIGITSGAGGAPIPDHSVRCILEASGGTTESVFTPADAGGNTSWVPVSGGSTTLRIINTNAGFALDASPVFGVDG